MGAGLSIKAREQRTEQHKRAIHTLLKVPADGRADSLLLTADPHTHDCSDEDQRNTREALVEVGAMKRSTILSVCVVSDWSSIEADAPLAEHCTSLLDSIDAVFRGSNVVQTMVCMQKEIIGIATNATQPFACVAAKKRVEIDDDSRLELFSNKASHLLTEWEAGRHPALNEEEEEEEGGLSAQLDCPEEGISVVAFRMFGLSNGECGIAKPTASYLCCICSKSAEAQDTAAEDGDQQVKEQQQPRVAGLSEKLCQIVTEMVCQVGPHLKAVTMVKLHQEEMMQEQQLLESLLFVNKMLFKKKVGLMTSLEWIIAHIRSIVHVDRVSIFIFNEKDNELWCKSNEGTGIRVPLVKKSIAGHVLLSGEALIIPDAYQDERFNPQYDKLNGYTTRNILCLPITNERVQVVGVIQVINKHDGQDFTMHDQHMVATVSEELALLLDSKSLEALYAMRAGEQGPNNSTGSVSGNADLKAMLNMYRESISGIGHKGSFSTASSLGNKGKNTSSEDLVTMKRSVDFSVPLVRQDMKSLLIPSQGVSESDRAKVLKSLFQWDFNIFGHSDSALVDLSVNLFRKFHVLEKFGIKESVLLTFLDNVRRGYLDNPYHNWKHGFSVLHCVTMVLCRTSALRFLKFDNVLGLLIASVAHDIGHTGTNNAFHVNAGTEIAITYNDQSVLENYHAAQTFALLKRDDCPLLGGLSREAQKSVRQVIIKAILATDMAHHFALVSRIKERISEHHGQFQITSPKEPVRSRLSVVASPKLQSKSSFYVANQDWSAADTHCPLDRSKLEDRLLLVEAVIHSGDLNNPTMKWELYEEWTDRVVMEFYEQSLKEAELGLESQPFMQKKPDDVRAKAQLQLNFIDFIVAPMWQVLNDMFPELKECTDRTKENRSRWQLILNEIKRSAGEAVTAEEESKEASKPVPIAGFDSEDETDDEAECKDEGFGSVGRKSRFDDGGGLETLQEEKGNGCGSGSGAGSDDIGGADAGSVAAAAIESIRLKSTSTLTEALVAPSKKISKAA